MSASPEIAAAFETWKLAELACHYAEPCPDALMNRLVDQQSDAFYALQAIPPANADDMLLKLFPFLNREFEPQREDGPFFPNEGESDRYSYKPGFFARLRDGLATVSPALASAMAEPKPQGRTR